jgi:hypothetical protein
LIDRHDIGIFKKCIDRLWLRHDRFLTNSALLGHVPLFYWGLSEEYLLQGRFPIYFQYLP